MGHWIFELNISPKVEFETAVGYEKKTVGWVSTIREENQRSIIVRYAARTGQNGHEHSVSARLDAVFIEL